MSKGKGFGTLSEKEAQNGLSVKVSMIFEVQREAVNSGQSVQCPKNGTKRELEGCSAKGYAES